MCPSLNYPSILDILSKWSHTDFLHCQKQTKRLCSSQMSKKRTKIDCPILGTKPIVLNFGKCVKQYSNKEMDNMEITVETTMEIKRLGYSGRWQLH